jgi:hypothetical protein
MNIRIGNVEVKLEMWRLSVAVMNDRLAPWMRWKTGIHTTPSLAIIRNSPVVLCCRR